VQINFRRFATISGYHLTLEGFSEGLICFFQFRDKTEQALHGFIDKQGQVVLNPRFEDAQNFSEGLALVKIKGKYGFIDRSGGIAIKAQFENAESFSGGLACVWIDGKLGYVDKAGKYVWEPTE
jgi:hypothetical protein